MTKFIHFPEQLRWRAVPLERRLSPLFLLGLVACALVAMILERNFLFAGIFIVGAFAFFIIGQRRPKPLTIELTSTGLSLDERMYPFRALKSFWLHDFDQGQSFVTFQQARWYLPYVRVPLHSQQDPAQVQGFLLQFLPQDEHTGSLSEALLSRIGF